MRLLFVFYTYHLQANGIDKRLHSQLEAVLLCHDKSLYNALPVVLIVLIAIMKDDWVSVKEALTNLTGSF